MLKKKVQLSLRNCILTSIFTLSLPEKKVFVMGKSFWKRGRIGRSLAKQAGRSSWCQIRSKSKCALKGCICKNMILLEKNVPLYYEVSVAAMLLQLSFTPMHCRIAQQVTVAVLVQYCPKDSWCFLDSKSLDFD